MAIDIRATITCSLGGNLISGSISDDYVQGSGLIRTRGDVEIYGLIAPKLGTAVTFSYTKGGVTRTLPRKLRVLSSFADPFRGTTKVQLGCKLTYLSDLKPAPTVDGDAPIETGKRQQCLNGYIEYPANSEFGIPIDAAGLMDTCLSKLGITASSNPLTNKFYRESFDFTPGYVTVLSDLLVSESYCGYLDENEKLQVFSLDVEGGTGPVLDATRLIDVGGIGVGDLPADAVVVRYETLKLKEDLSGEAGDPESVILSQRDWEREEVTGSLQEAEVRFTRADGTVVVNTYTYRPYTVTVSEYGEDNSWDDNVCVIASTVGEGADLSNTVVKRTTYTNVLKALEANDFCAKAFAFGVNPGAGETVEAVEVEEYEFDSEGNQIRSVTYRYEPRFAWVGRLNLELVYGDQIVLPGSAPVLVEKVVRETTTLYAQMPYGAYYVKPGETIEPVANGSKTVTTTYRNWALSQQGNNAIAAIRENAPFTTAGELAGFLASIDQKLVLVNTEISTQSGRILVGYQRRPPKELRMMGDNAERTETTSQLIYTTGNSGGQRIIELSMPYQSDDYYTATGTIVRSDAAEKAARYGRCQNRLLLGNRQGINVQAEPERLPRYPYKPFTVSAAGLSALYRTNGMSWTFSSEGIVASTDALFWGATGQTGGGSIYVPVAPGVTSLPAPPAVTDTSPSSVIGTVATVGTNAQTTLNTAFPSATTGQGVQDTSTDEFWVKGAGGTWTNVGATPGPTSTVTTVVPVANETVVANGIVRCKLAVTSFSYALEQLTVVAPLMVRSKLVAATIRKVEVPATTITAAAVAPVVSIGAAVRPAATAIAVAAVAPAVSAGASINPGAVDLALAVAVPAVSTGTSVAVPVQGIGIEAQVPTSVGPLPLLVYVPAANVTVAAAAPVVVTGASVAVPAVEVTVAAPTPTVTSVDPSFSSVTLLLHADGSNNSTTFVDSSSAARTITVNGNAKISTAQSKFGGSSVLLDGATDWLYTGPDVGNFGTGDLTVECWVRWSSLTNAGIFHVFNGTPSSVLTGLGLGWQSNNFVIYANGAGTARAYTPSTNTWYHVALVRSGGDLTLYVNGVAQGAAIANSTNYSNVGINIGLYYSSQYTLNGYIDEFRVSKVARYTSGFTPTTVAFPDA